MPDLVTYLQTVPELTGGVHARKPSTQPTGPHVIWEASAGSRRLTLANEEGHVWARAVAVFLYVPESAGRTVAETLTERIAGATREVNEWPGLPFWGLLPGSDIGPFWDGDRWTSTVRFTLLYLRA